MSLSLEMIHGVSGIDGVPVDNGARDEVQPRRPDDLLSNELPRISPRLWTNTARVSL
jgi:hypothetical protein